MLHLKSASGTLSIYTAFREENMTPNRQMAFELLKEFNSDESLIRHALSVEGVMRHIARSRGEDEEKWGIIGLLHDLDYQQYPEEHCKKKGQKPRERDWPEDYIRAIMSHGFEMFTDIKPESDMEKFLYAIDELTGLVAATALVRPSKSVMDMKPKSVKKKWKDKSFAAGVNREVIEKGAEMLGMETGELIELTIEGMKEVATQVGLEGIPGN